MRYNIGDIVTIREDLECYVLYPHDDGSCMTYVTDEMATMSGKTAMIVRINGGDRYNIDIDGGGWSWTDGMFVNDTIADECKIKDDYADVDANDFMEVFNEI